MLRLARHRNPKHSVTKALTDPMTEILQPDARGIARAAAVLTAGGLVALPTETVYGLAADARNGTAVARIYEAKGRPSFNPLIVHLADAEHARRYGVWSDNAEILAAAFWPGPLTLVLPLADNHGLSSLVTAGLDSVALRVPAHPTARAILQAFDGPIAAPSANPSGRISATTAAHVLAGLDGRIDAVVDDGPCAVGVESTIIGLNHATPTLLRAGACPSRRLRRPLACRSTWLTGRKSSRRGKWRHITPPPPRFVWMQKPRWTVKSCWGSERWTATLTCPPPVI